MDQPYQQKRDLKWLYYLVGAIIIVAAIFFVWKKGYISKLTRSTEKQPETQSQTQTEASRETLKVNRIDVDNASIPDKLPKDLPNESGAKITQNFTATTEDGRFQSTRVYETAKSLDENATIFSEYLKTHGWKESANISQDRLRVLSGSKDSDFLTVTINENSITKVRTVEITLLETSTQQNK